MVKLDYEKDGLVAIEDNEDLIILRESEIYYMKSSERKTVICTRTSDYLSAKPLSYYERKLQSVCFFKCYRSYLINLMNVNRCVPNINYTYDVHFDGIEHRVPVSRDKARILKSLLLI